MPSCSSIESLVTPYVDGELSAAERRAVDQHLGECPGCHSRLAAEQVVRDLLRERKTAFRAEAPSLLRSRCVQMAAREIHAVQPTALSHAARGATTSRGLGTRWRGRLAPVAAAASLVVIVGGAFLYQATEQSSRVMAAELTADHMKCFAMNAVLGTRQSAESVESSMAAGFGWDMKLPIGMEREGLELVGSRPCLYGQGKVAHIMYRHNGRPVSLFMLPSSARPEQLVEVLGHECAIWSADDRTYVLVAREDRSDVQRLAALVHAGMR